MDVAELTKGNKKHAASFKPMPYSFVYPGPWVHERIRHWLEARRVLLITFCELSNIHDFLDEDPVHGKLLQTFCQQLVDYISEGHFEIFEQLINEGLH